jgi:HlyD family secretion protein
MEWIHISEGDLGMKSFIQQYRIYLIIALAVILVGSGAYAAYRIWYLPSHQATSEESSLQTATARRGELVLYAAGAGTLIPSSEVDVSFDLSDNATGVLEELLVEVGDEVQAGDVLAQLDDTNLQENLLDAQRSLRELTSPAAIAALEKDLAETEIDLDDKTSDLAGLISPEVYNAEQMLAKYQAALDEAQAAVDSTPSEENQALLKKAQQNVSWAKSNLYTQQQYYRQEYLPDNFTDFYWEGNKKVEYINAPTEAEIASVRAEIKLDQANIEEMQVVLDSLQNGLELPEDATGTTAAELRQARQAVVDAQADLDAATLVAPISGTVTAINVQKTEKVTGSDVVLTIADLTPPTLEAYFDESDWKNIQVGFPVEVVFDALPDVTYEGSVIHVDPALVTQDFTTVVYSLAELDTSTTGWQNLPVGSAADVDVIGGKAENAILVPVEALHEISEGQYAVFVLENGKLQMKLVEVGLQDLVYAEITSGLQEGDVVSTGQVETAQ